MNEIRIFAIMSENKNIEENEKSADEGRREALKKLGTYAFAAPVMMSLVASNLHSAHLMKKMIINYKFSHF